MFVVEIRVNGNMIMHIYGRNTTGIKDQSLYNRYEYEIYEVSSKKITHGEVSHKQEDGIKALVATILRE